jgi:hypothetical protein
MYSQQDLKAIEANINDEKVGGNVTYNHLQGIGSRSMTTSTISVTEKRTLGTQSHVSKGDWHFLAAFGCLSLINLMCAIDATILSVALPVCYTPRSAMMNSLLSLNNPDNGCEAQRISHRSVLVRLLSMGFNSY